MKIKLTLCNKIAGLLILCLTGQVHLLLAQAPQFEWVEQMGGRKYDNGNAIALDAAGNMYITGSFTDTVDMDPGPKEHILVAHPQDAYVAKLDHKGNLVWVWQMEGNCTGVTNSIALDTMGNIYVSGSFIDSVDVDPGPTVRNLLAKAGAFFVKLDTAGKLVWSVKINNALINSITTGPSGSLYFTGYSIKDSVTFDPGSGIAPIYATYRTMFNHLYPNPFILVGKIASGGSLSWTYGFVNTFTSAQQGYQVVTDKAEHVFVTGKYGGSMDFDPGPDSTILNAKGGIDIFVLKMDSAGKLMWAKSMGGAGNDEGHGIAVDGCGDVYSSGTFSGKPADFDPGTDSFMMTPVPGVTNPNLALQDIFISKLDANGNFIWAKAISGPAGEYNDHITLDRYGAVYITGEGGQGTDFDPGADSFSLPQDIVGVFFSKLDENGNFIWAGGINKGNAKGALPAPAAIIRDDSGKIYVLGLFQDTIDFDPGAKQYNLISGGQFDMFLLKLSDPDYRMPVYDTTTVASCDSFILEQHTYTTSGFYKLSFLSSSGCDSTAILHLMINHMDQPTINVNGFTLGTTGTYMHYQWLLNGSLIPGATQQFYTVTENGTYTVMATDSNGCSNISEPYQVTNYTGIGTISSIAGQINIYPNPADHIVYIQSPVKINVILTGMDGQMIRQVKHARSISIKDLASGLYLLRITNEHGALIKVEKVIRQR